MKITMGVKPVFCITMTIEQINLFIAMSELHYDRICRSASQPGGFLLTWKAGQEWADAEKESTVHSADFGRLDTLLKIGENSVVLCPADRDVSILVCRHFRNALATCNKQLPHLEWHVPE